MCPACESAQQDIPANVRYLKWRLYAPGNIAIVACDAHYQYLSEAIEMLETVFDRLLAAQMAKLQTALQEFLPGVNR